jgi:uncharacterized protein YciI
MRRAKPNKEAAMQFDRYTITLLIKPEDAPRLDEQAAAALQDAHMSHLADLHAAGQLLIAGPLFDEDYRGLSILNVDPAEAVALKQQDPAVRAGIYTVRAIPWMVPSGAMAFSPARFPRSVAEASRGG